MRFASRYLNTRVGATHRITNSEAKAPIPRKKEIIKKNTDNTKMTSSEILAKIKSKTGVNKTSTINQIKSYVRNANRDNASPQQYVPKQSNNKRVGPVIHEKSELKVLLCCILKMENHYLKEWVDHYKKIGVDKIVIYDNNDLTGPNAENIEDVPGIKEMIDDKFIDVYKVPGQNKIQHKVYNECYQKYNKDYDWLMFFDLDEFMMFEKASNVKDFLNNEIYDRFDIVQIPWKVYDDNGLVTVKDGDYSLVNRFKRSAAENGIRCECQIKSIIRGGLDGLQYTAVQPHAPGNNNFITCGNDGAVRRTTNINSSFKPIGAWLNHYICKTVQEYVETKNKRGGANTGKCRSGENFFFRFNKRTPEKVDYFRKYAKK